MIESPVLQEFVAKQQRKWFMLVHHRTLWITRQHNRPGARLDLRRREARRADSVSAEMP